VSAELRTEVLVIGGGPSGLSAAAALSPACRVLVLDREVEAGGIPRHSHHTGYGVRDLRTVTTGPKYARRLVDAARTAGVDIRTEAMVTGWAGGRTVEVTTPQGRITVTADAVVLATGARERPRTARLIAGDRPAGVLTTGLLQNLVHLQHRAVGTRAVVVGSELVSWSAVLTLREAGCSTVLMTTERSHGESYAALRVPASVGLRVPVATRTRVVRIVGRDRVEGVDVQDLVTGLRRHVPCDVVVMTGDWIPDHELARLAGVELDPGTLGPQVDARLRTSQPGVFAIGNLVHPVDTADVAAIDGRHVASSVRRWFDGGAASTPAPGVPLVADPPFTWVAPNLVRPGDGAPARRRILLWTDERRLAPRIAVHQDGREIARRTLPWPAVPGRVLRVPASVLDGVRADGGPVRIRLV
jgi:thioredoxin reductase